MGNLISHRARQESVIARTRVLKIYPSPDPAPPPTELWASGPLLSYGPTSEVARSKKLLCGQRNAPHSLASRTPALSTFLPTPFTSRPPPLREHPPPQDSLRGLDFDRHSVIFPGAGLNPLSGLVAPHTNDTSGGRLTSLPPVVRRPLWR